MATILEVVNIDNYRSSYYAFPLFLTSLLTLAMGVYVFARIHPTKLGFRFFLFTAVLGAWLTTFGLAYSTSQQAIALWWLRLGICAVTLIPAANYAFVDALLQKQQKRLRYARLIYIVSFCFVALNLLSDLIIRNVKQFYWGYYPQYGKLGIFLVGFFVAIVALVFVDLWFEYKDAVSERNRKRMKGLLFGICAGYFAAADHLAGFGVAAYPFGYLPVLAFVAIFTYVIVRFRLSDITPQTAATQILQTMQGALIVVDVEGKIKLVNRAASETFGRDEADLINQPVSIVLDLPAEVSDYHKLTQRGVKDFELSVANASGRKMFLKLSASVLVSSDGKPTGIVYVAADITNEKEVEGALERAKDSAEELVSQRTAMLSKTVDDLTVEITKRMEMEAALTKAAEQWRVTFDSTRDMILMLDSGFSIIKANRAAMDFFHLSISDIVGSPAVASSGQFAFLMERDLLYTLRDTKTRTERELFLADRQMWLVISADPITDDSGNYVGAVLLIRDVSDIKKGEEERRKLHAQLLQVQKMESIGRLAGGIAHDFNNVLSSIMGFSELALLKLPFDHPSRDHIKTIFESGERAAALTRQLLAFSRQQVLEMKVVNVNTTIANLKKMLERLIGEHIQLVVRPSSLLKHVLADNVQIEQVVMNLVVNARDAMPGGGVITITTAHADVNKGDTIVYEGLKPGRYVVMTVTDTGEGMSPETQKNIFEPFFTTKPMGKGTGLGLATVYGIIKQHQGYIYVQSELGRGTEFRIYLPVVDEKKVAELAKNELGLSGGAETILIVDDDAAIRNLLTSCLAPLGYKILQASNAERALNVSNNYEGTIDLLVTDIVMPGMDGQHLAELMRAERPGIKVILLSGYTDQIVKVQKSMTAGMVYMSKPILPTVLSDRVRRILDGVP